MTRKSDMSKRHLNTKQLQKVGEQYPKASPIRTAVGMGDGKNVKMSSYAKGIEQKMRNSDVVMGNIKSGDYLKQPHRRSIFKNKKGS